MELVRSFSNISFFFIVSLSFFIAIEHVRLKIIIRNTSDVIGNRSISLRKMNIILVPFLLPLKLSPIWQIRSIPVVTTDVHRSTNRRNKIPNYPWKKHDKIVRNWHPSSHLHTSTDPSLPPSTCVKPMFDEPTFLSPPLFLLLSFQRNKTMPHGENTRKNASRRIWYRDRNIRLVIGGKKKSNIDSRG